jgi:hypothetical protein
MNLWTRFKSWFRTVDLSDEIDTVQRLTVQCCGFLPTVGTVASIVTAGNPTVLTATAVATAICSAVSPTKTAQGLLSMDGPPTVNGVVVEGGFVSNG